MSKAGPTALAVASVVVASLLCGCPTTRPMSLQGLTPESHRWFPVAPGKVHALGRAAFDGEIRCESCHAAAATTFTEFACVGCHEHRQFGMDADGSPGMDALHASKPGYAYNSAACLACHPNGESGEISRADHSAQYFPITTDTRHGALGCSECHTGASRNQVTCTGCHRDDNGDAMQDHDVAPMLAVHGTDMAALGYRWESNACLGCHPRAQVPGILNHEPAFPIAPGTVHGNAGATACVDCHVSQQEHSQLACITCHMQAGGQDVHGEAPMADTHGSIPGYAWESNACFACHQQSQVPGMLDHDRYFPIGAGAVHELGKALDDDPGDAIEPVTVACNTCHQDPANQRNVSCLDCHAHAQNVMQPTHGVFPDYSWDNAACVFCHIGGQKKINHTFFPVQPGLTHALDDTATPAVDGMRCMECHASKLDRTRLACTTCHRHDGTQSMTDHGADMSRHGYSFDSGACFNCHPGSQVPGNFDHEPIWPLLPPSGNGQHQGLQCVDCHASRADRLGSLQCTTCHQPTSSTDPRDVHGQPRMGEVHGNIPGYVWSPRVCVSCHTDGTKESALVNLDHTWFPISTGRTHAVTANGGTLNCVDCHSVEGDFAVANITCVTCHQQRDDGTGLRDVHGQPRLGEVHASVDGYAWANSACLGCHPHGEASGIIDHTWFPISAGSAHDTVGCASCHLGTGPKSDVTQLNCSGCHTTTVNLNPTPDQIHLGITNYANNSPACLTCHPNAEPVGPFDHVAFFPISAGSRHATAAYAASVGAGKTSCTACHASRTNRAQNLCAECHATVPTSVLTALAPAHSRVRDYVNANADCKACHAEGTTPNLSQHSAFSFNHEGATCRECHSDLQACLANASCANATGEDNARNNLVRTAMRTDKTWAVDWQQYACLKCHKHNRSREESRHVGKRRNGFTFVSYANPGCAACH